MVITKSEFFEEMKSKGFSPELEELISDYLGQFSEELSQEDVDRIDLFLAEVEASMKVTSDTYGKIATELEHAEEDMLYAMDKLMDRTEQMQADDEAAYKDLVLG